MLFMLILVAVSVCVRMDAVAATLEYRLIDGRIGGITDTAPPVRSGYAQVDVVGFAADFLFPSPAGCGQGRIEWSRYNSDTLVVELKPSMTVLECRTAPSDGVTLDRAIMVLIEKILLDDGVSGEAARRLGELLSRCSTVDIRAACVSARAEVDVIVPSAGTAIDTLRTRAATLRSTKGW